MQLKSRWAYIWRNRKKKRHRGGRYGKYLFLLPGLIGVFLLVLFPFADVVRRSFMTALSGQFTGFCNYGLLLENRAFLLAVKNTVRFVAVALPFLLGCSLLLALGMYRYSFLEKVKYLYLLPLAMPSATVVLVWKMLFDEHGFLNAWLQTHV
ncbi:MAG: sugar ABC transporter permease, partial [Lachnospiraceae bacterium]